MTKEDVELIVEEEGLSFAYNLLEDRPDVGNELVVKPENDHYVLYQTDEQAQVIEDNRVRVIGEEDAFNMLLTKLRAMKRKQYEQFFKEIGAKRVLRKQVEKTFVSTHDFEATYHELYKTEGGKLFSVIRIDPAPGGYGEEYMYIKEVYELDIDVKENTYSDEELLNLVFDKGARVR